MKNTIIGAAFVVVCLMGSLVGFSLTIGWNIISMAIFWYIIAPGLAYAIPGWILREGNLLQASLAGLSVFYLGMIFLIYEHYETDYFQLMLISLAVNVAVIFLIHRVTKRKRDIP